MAPTCSREEVEYFINHCVLPPKLPHELEDEEEEKQNLLEAGLLKLTVDSLRRFRARCAPKDRRATRQCLQGLEAAIAIHNTSSRDINEDDLAAHFATMAKDDLDAPLPLHIKSQNCGLMIRCDKGGMVFEAFELSATNSSVTGTTGRLTRSFPTSAVFVDSQHVKQQDFRATIARTLASMACEPAPGMQPQIQKAGKDRDELRDTVNPAIVTRLFFGAFLESIGSRRDVSAVQKNTRDEVLWRDTLKPWRRSPTWLLIRVYLQLTFQRAESREGFKKFMVTFLADLLEIAQQSTLPSAVLYAMSAKISRRLVKFGSPLHAQILDPVRTVLDSCSQILCDRWMATQRHEECLDTAGLQSLQLSEDSLLHLPELDDHLHMMAQRRSKDRNASFCPNSGLLQLEAHRWPRLPTSFATYEPANLNILEDWITSSLRKCMNAYDADTACQEAYGLMRRYYDLASKIYAENPEALSCMILTILEIWVCCDERATSACDWLREYDTGIPQDIFQNLLLPSRSQMSRLHKVEQHLSVRAGKHPLLGSTLVSGDTTDRACFPARCFDEDDDHQFLMEQINASSQEKEARKLTELEGLQEKREDLKQRSEKETHAEREVLERNKYGRVISCSKAHDDPNCQKCWLLKRANGMRIDVYEWPLPRETKSAETKAKAIVFELDRPEWFASWRDCTAFLTLDILKSQYVESKQISARWELKDNFQLGWAYRTTSRRSRGTSSVEFGSEETSFYDSSSDLEPDEYDDAIRERIVMASAKKPFKASHYKEVKVTDATAEKDVIVPSGARYHYFDLSTQTFVGPQQPTAAMTNACTYRMPARSKALDRYLRRTATAQDGEPPNSAIAMQFTCPTNMTVNEFLELCSVPYGHLLQWRHIAAQLHAPSVDLRKEETALVFLQCIYQTGPAVAQPIDNEYDSLRASHVITGHTDLQRGLLVGLNGSLNQIKQNWESANVVLILAAIAARMISLCPSVEVQREGRHFLERCRDVASAWLQTLRAKIQEASIGADRTEFLIKSVEVACICMLTFDLDVTVLEDVLACKEQASLFIQCSMILSELNGGVSANTAGILDILKLRFQRTMYRSHQILSQNHAALDDAISKSWAAYRPGSTRWEQASANWVTKQISLSGGDDMSVHFDLLSGELRVNGERLKRTPKAYEAQPLYAALFGRVGVEVLESRVRGMRFSAKKDYEGFGIHLNLKGGCELTVQARSNVNTYETLPAGLLQGELPDSFLHDYVHWYNQASGEVEFRPKQSPWPTNSSDIWTLSRDQGQWRLSKDGTCVMGSRSATTKHFATLLSPLIPSSRIHLLLDPSRQRLDVDLPSLQLGFYFEQGTTSCLSKEFRGMAVDPDQHLGTLIGFRNKLLLRHPRSGDRLALIPEGQVTYESRGDHVSVTVDGASVSKVHPIQVDARLGRLVDNGSMQCKLFLAYLHALTAFCLPDPLTRKTGTEQALSILYSAAVRSFDVLTEANKQLLAQIAKLSPGRAYYPKDDQLMQTVTWDNELSFLTQHGWFYRAVKAIFAQAKRSSCLHPESTLRLPVINHVAENLLERDAIRTSAFRISEFGAEDHTTRHDVEYTASDRSQHSKATENAFKLSLAISTGNAGLIWRAPTPKQLCDPVSKVLVVPGPLGELDMIRYDPSLLASTAVSVTQHLLPVHSMISKAYVEGKSFDKYRLMMWLATVAFSPEANLEVIQTAALLATTPQVRGVSIPDVDYCSPSDGRTCKTNAARDALVEHCD